MAPAEGIVAASVQHHYVQAVPRLVKVVQQRLQRDRSVPQSPVPKKRANFF